MHAYPVSSQAVLTVSDVCGDFCRKESSHSGTPAIERVGPVAVFQVFAVTGRSNDPKQSSATPDSLLDSRHSGLTSHADTINRRIAAIAAGQPYATRLQADPKRWIGETALSCPSSGLSWASTHSIATLNRRLNRK